MVEYKSSANTVFSAKNHIVFTPKYRLKILVGGVDVRFKQIVEGLAERLRFEILEMEVMPDHVHLLLEVAPQVGITSLVGRIKGVSSRVLRQEFPILRSLPSLWTNSCFVSTVGGAPLEIVKRYIEEQKNVR
jgi:putative transposase